MNLAPSHASPSARTAVTGFSLVEMIIVISIIAILVGMAVPNFSDFIANSRQRSMASDLAGDLAEARTEAMKRHTTVTVTNGGTWLDGWNTQTNSGEPFVDANGNNVYDAGEVYDDRNDNGAYDAGVAVTLKSAQPFTGSSLRGCAVSSGGTVVSGAFLNQIVFRGDGTVANAAIGAEDGIRLSDVTNRLTTDIRDIQIAPTGRITVDVIRAGDPKRAALTPCPGP